MEQDWTWKNKLKVAPYTLVQYLYRSVSNFRRPANVLKYSDHEKLFFEAFLRRNCQVRNFIAKLISLRNCRRNFHSNIFVKPKQCVSCLLVLWCFSPWFCKFSRLVCSVLKVFVRMSSRFFITSAMFFYGFQCRLSPVSFGEFFKNFVQLFQQS